MPTTFTESDLRFTFSDKWIIKAYDEHPFYKSLAGHGLKGVDFIGLLNHETVVLIEVKNYKIRFPSALPPIQNKITGDHPRIVQTMIRKAKDTKRAVRVIRKYHERQWWLRPFSFLVKMLPLHWQLKIEWNFWMTIEQKLKVDDYVLVLWMELEKEYKFFTQDDIQSAREKVVTCLQDYFIDTNITTLVADRFANKIDEEEIIVSVLSAS